MDTEYTITLTVGHSTAKQGANIAKAWRSLGFAYDPAVCRMGKCWEIVCGFKAMSHGDAVDILNQFKEGIKGFGAVQYASLDADE